MGIVLEKLPAVQEFEDTGLWPEIKGLVEACNLSTEHAQDYNGWLVAREIGTAAILGCVGYETRDKNVHMQSLAVRPEIRRQGIAARLTDALYEQLEDQQQLVAFTLWPQNHAFYRHLGFLKAHAPSMKAADEVGGRRKHHYCTAWVKSRR